MSPHASGASPAAWSWESPIIQGLIAQGAAAVEPPARSLRTDGRPTRPGGFPRDSSGGG